MKKQLLTGAMLLATYFGVNAQETLFSEDFNDDFTYEGWTEHIEDEGTNNSDMAAFFPAGTGWSVLLFQNAPDNAFAASTSFFEEEGIAADRWVVTPAIEIPENATSVTLTFEDASGDPNIVDDYELYVSTTGTEIADLGEAIYAEVADSDSFTERTVDLTEYAGETIHISWRHITEGGFLLFIDNVEVTAEMPAGVNETLASKFSVFPNPATNVINITNADNVLVNGVSIADLNGRTVKTAKFEGVSEAQINVSDLASGVYMMTVSSDKGTTTKKIVKN